MRQVISTVLIGLALSSPVYAHDTDSKTQRKSVPLTLCVKYPYESLQSAAEREKEFRDKYGAPGREITVDIGSANSYSIGTTTDTIRWPQ